ncbi:MAG: hypothetical protein WC468_02290, partial [Candidatus Paceibacterota bacterium]
SDRRSSSLTLSSRVKWDRFFFFFLFFMFLSYTKAFGFRIELAAEVPFQNTGVIDPVAAAKKVDYVEALMGPAKRIRSGQRSAAGPLFNPAFND